MVANVAGPCSNDLAEPRFVPGKQCPGGFLEARLVAGKSRHESIGSSLRLAPSILIAISASCLLDELAQSD